MEIIPYQDFQVSMLEELPPHLTYSEYNQLRQVIKDYWASKNPRTSRKRDFFCDRDLLLIDLIWETGGRISDIAQTLTFRMFNFEAKILNLFVEKVDKVLPIPLDDEILLFVSKYCHKHDIKDKLFGMTRQRAWQIMRRYAQLASIPDLHPHKFRHGIAVHLLQSHIPVPVISKRLGHSSTVVTQKMYLKITPEIQRQILKDVKWRD